MTEPRRCPDCGGEIAADAPAGLCPKCLLKAGMESQPAAAQPAPTAAHTPANEFLPPSVDELGPRFPQLEILELLGKGGMGAVYKARHKGLDRLVAVKILPPESHQASFADRFTREARALARLNHPHIVSVHDFGQTSDGLFFFVMEYVEGVNLRQAMQAGNMKPEQAIAIVPQICEALQYAHDEGIVHRDIKPENILIDKKGRVKIADFGLAKLLASDPASGGESPVSLTGTHQVMGTLRYMAPEQLEGSKLVDHRADIYSLGVVFYELLTGEVPMGRFAPPSKKVQIDVRLDEVVLRALEREPEQRWQHASEVRTEVETIRTTNRDRERTSAKEKASSLRNADDEHPLLKGLRFWMTPQAGYGRWVGVPMLILTSLVVLAGVSIAVAVPTEEEWVHLLTIASSFVLLGIAFVVLNMLWAVKGKTGEASLPNQVSAPGESDTDYARRKITGPAVALMIAAIINILGQIAWVGFFLADAHTFWAQVWTVAFPAWFTILSFILLGAAGGLLRLETSSLGDFAITCSLIMPPGLLIAIPAVILYWVRYEDPRVKAAFALNEPKQERTDDPPPARPSSRRLWISILAILSAVVCLGFIANHLWHRPAQLRHPLYGDTGFVQGENGPEMGGALIAKLGVPPAQVAAANRVFQTYYDKYLALERRHTKYTRDDQGHVHITIEPFVEEMHALVKDLHAELGGIVDQRIAPKLPEKGKVHSALPLFRQAGEATVTITLWKENHGGAGHTHFFKEDVEWLDGNKANSGRSGWGVDTFPERFRLYWTEPGDVPTK
jgi:tRNA A-37 threonylcarbamoyl transferase component Bud32